MFSLLSLSWYLLVILEGGGLSPSAPPPATGLLSDTNECHLMVSDVNECYQDPTACPGDTICENTRGSYTCVCPAGYVWKDIKCEGKFS